MHMVASSARSHFECGSDIDAYFACQADNQHVQVDTWEVVVGGRLFSINLLFPYSAPQGALWLVGSARDMRSAVWGYKDDSRVRAGFQGLAYLAAVDEVTYVVFQTKGQQPAVAHLVPLCDLLFQRTVAELPGVSALRKQKFAAERGLGVEYTAEEDAAINYRTVTICQKDGRRLEKVAHVKLGYRLYYQVVDQSGKVMSGPFSTLIDGQRAIGYVPEPPKTAPGNKTNIGGLGHVKGPTGQRDSAPGDNKHRQKGRRGKKTA